jgi:hypothetical protein
MNLKKYYSTLLKKAKDRDDLTVEKYTLPHKRRNFAFYKFKSRYIGPGDRVLLCHTPF